MLEELKVYLNETDDDISNRFAIFLNHNFGNIKRDGVIRQYQFLEGDKKEDVLYFLQVYYPDIYEKVV